MDFVKKNGLLYSPDLHTLLGVDTSTSDFTGRVPFGAHNVDDEVFSEAPYEAMSLPDSVKKVGAKLFKDSKNLKKLKLPSVLDELSPYMCAGCSSLEKLTMPNEVPFFPEGVFKDCVSIAEIPFRTDCVSVGLSAFEGCTGVKAIVIPDSVEKIESRAFANCTGVESLVIGAHCYEIASDSFAGCSSLHHIRVVEENDFFNCDENGNLVSKEDGHIVINVAALVNESVSFFEQPDAIDLSASNSENAGIWIDAGDEDEEADDTFSAEIGAGSEEMAAFDVGAEPAESPAASVAVPTASETMETPDVSEPAETPEPVKTSVVEEPIENVEQSQTNIDNNEKMESTKMSDNLENGMLADIMNQNTSTEGESIGITEQESQILSQAMDVMSAASSQTNTAGAVSNEELVNLFQDQEPAEDENSEDKNLEKNLRILCSSVEFSLIQEFQPSGESPRNSDLYVVAEKLVPGADGKETISDRLKACCEKLASIHDLKRVIYISGLDMDNDEFVAFFHNLVVMENVLLACDAASPSTLSPYCKAVCDHADISLDKDEIVSQRKKAGIRNPSLIKLIVQDKY